MKKIFYLAIIINLFNYQSVLSLSKQYEREIYAGCYEEAKKRNSIDLEKLDINEDSIQENNVTHIK